MTQKSEGKSGVRRGLPLQPFPIEDPLASLPKTAQKILSAAQRLLAERGYDAVTLENVAAEAAVNKASIRYNFGNKAGLMAAVVDALMHAEFARMAQEMPVLQHDERLDAAMAAKRRMILSADEFRGFFDILPHAIRNDELRGRIAALYPWWFEQNLQWLGLQGGGPEGRDELIQGLGQLITAVVDGLSVQVSLEQDDFDPSPPLRTLRFLMANSMAELEELAAEQERAHAGGDGAGSPQAAAPKKPAAPSRSSKK
jgi:AcrR family transcriptional regulator